MMMMVMIMLCSLCSGLHVVAIHPDLMAVIMCGSVLPCSSSEQSHLDPFSLRRIGTNTSSNSPPGGNRFGLGLEIK